MKIQYLGTAAAEGIPAIFCTCEKCRKARELGGKNIRTRSQAMIDDKILIDFPPDTFLHGITYHIDFAKIRTLLITHAHRDHFYPLDFDNRRKGMSDLTNGVPLTIYGSKDIKEQVMEYARFEDGAYGVKFCEVYPFQTFETEDGYRITPLKAQHPTDNPYIYLIAYQGKVMLYAHDTGLFPAETYEYLLKQKIKIDMLSLDCTEGTREIDYFLHMNVQHCEKLTEQMKKDGIITDKTIICLNHFSHNGENCLYEEMKEVCKAKGFVGSYDGMVIEF